MKTYSYLLWDVSAAPILFFSQEGNEKYKAKTTDITPGNIIVST